MKKYLGIKTLEARPMNRLEYNNYRGWQIPLDEDPLENGYLVKYPDGYESWSPEEQFELAYTEFDDTKPFSSYGKIVLDKFLGFLSAAPSSREKSILLTKIEELQLWIEHKL